MPNLKLHALLDKLSQAVDPYTACLSRFETFDEQSQAVDPFSASFIRVKDHYDTLPRFEPCSTKHWTPSHCH